MSNPKAVKIYKVNVAHKQYSGLSFEVLVVARRIPSAIKKGVKVAILLDEHCRQSKSGLYAAEATFEGKAYL